MHLVGTLFPHIRVLIYTEQDFVWYSELGQDGSFPHFFPSRHWPCSKSFYSRQPDSLTLTLDVLQNIHFVCVLLYMGFGDLIYHISVKKTYVEIKCQLDTTEVFIVDLIACSTCFGHHYAHHQELKRIIYWLVPVVFRAVVLELLVWCGAEGYVFGFQDVATSCKLASCFCSSSNELPAFI